MLILTRRTDERVSILGGLIQIVVTEILDNRVRLGFIAEPIFDIHRSEIQAKIDVEDSGITSEIRHRIRQAIINELDAIHRDRTSAANSNAVEVIHGD